MRTKRTASTLSKEDKEVAVAARLAQRAAVIEQKRAKGDALKDEGNALFKGGRHEEAIKKYLAAVAAYGPRAVYMNNLAAALLKLERFAQAEDAAHQALHQNPRLLKARYRRGLARKGLGELAFAAKDFEDVLRLDPNCAEAKEELASTRGVLAQRHKIRHSKGRYDGDISDEEEDRNAWMVDASARPTLQDPDMETPFESDTDDLWHEGNGVPCRYYNHDGCKLGTACRSKHAPDNRSVRDHLGRNVCMYYLLCICKFGADRCVYAHDKTHLEPGGWWNNPARVRGNVEGLHECEMMAGHAAMDELLGPMWNGAIRKGAYLLLPQSGDEDEEGEDEDEDDNDRLAREAFQRDLREVMAATTSGPASGASRGRGGGQKSGHGRGHGRGRRQGGKRGGGRRQKSSLGGMFEGRGDRGTLRSMSEEDERMMNCGYTFDEMNDLICQGIKPWD